MGVGNLLVVEDYPPLATVIAISLRRLGHEVLRLGSVQRAETVEGPFDAAVLDIELPDGSGIVLAEDLLNEGRARSVVFFSAVRDTNARQRALRLGPVVDKVDGIEALASVVAEQLEVQAGLARAVGAADGVVPQRVSGRSGTRRKLK